MCMNVHATVYAMNYSVHVHTRKGYRPFCRAEARSFAGLILLERLSDAGEREGDQVNGELEAFA